MRLFFAIGFSEEIKDKLCAVLENLRPCCPEGRFTLRENLHLTLVFLGEVSPGALQAVNDAMETTHAAPFTLHVGGMGCFHRDGGDLYWAGVERTELLVRLYDSLRRELQRRDFVTESRPYRPHLTLVRQAVLEDGCDRSVFVVPAMHMRVEKFSLMKSERKDGRLLYTEIGCRALEEGK